MSINSRRNYIIAATIAVASMSLSARTVSNLRAGQLSNAGISQDETELTISGNMNAADFSYILDNLYALNTLDISGVNIVAYDGDILPYTGMNNSPAGTIPDYGLTGLTNLKTLKLPRGLKAIGRGSLSGTGITELEVPSSVTTIGAYAAMRCENLTSLTIPGNVTSIGSRAFAYCTKLSAVTLDANLSEIPEGLFEACGAIRQLSLEALANCAEIGPWALAECNGINTLVLPAGTEVINTAALYGAKSIDTLVLPEELNFIGDNAMSGLSALELLNASNVVNVPDLGENVWSQVETEKITLVTPDDKFNEYKDADQWNRFHVISYDDWHASTENIASSIDADDLQIYVSGAVLYVKAPRNEPLGRVSVYNIGGSRVATTMATDSASFNVSAWTKGIYLVVTDLGAAKVGI